METLIAFIHGVDSDLHGGACDLLNKSEVLSLLKSCQRVDLDKLVRDCSTDGLVIDCSTCRVVWLSEFLLSGLSCLLNDVSDGEHVVHGG